MAYSLYRVFIYNNISSHSETYILQLKALLLCIYK